MIRDVEQLGVLVALHRKCGEAAIARAICDRAGAGQTPPPEGLLPEDILPLSALCDRDVRAGRELAVRLAERGFGAVMLLHTSYPERLRRLLGRRAPAVLYVRGAVELFDTPGVSIIGTRRPGPQGRHAALQWAAGLARAGWTVVSGNAPGIDAAAHGAALAAGGCTLVFPPTPPDRFEPAFALRDEEEKRLLVASPFVPASAVEPWCFLRRNELVAAQAGTAIVAETGTRGGTLNTVKHVKSLGRELFVVKLPADAPRRGAHEMLVAGGGTWLPDRCTPAALGRVADAAQRPAPPTLEMPDLFEAGR